MARAAQKGELENPSPEVSKIASTVSKSDVKKMASTKHKGLPEKKPAEVNETVSLVSVLHKLKEEGYPARREGPQKGLGAALCPVCGQMGCTKDHDAEEEVKEGVGDTIKKGLKRHKKAVDAKKVKERKAPPYAALAAEHEPEGEMVEDVHSGQGEKIAARTKKWMYDKGQKGAPGLDAMKARTAEHKAKRGVKEEMELEEERKARKMNVRTKKTIQTTIAKDAEKEAKRKANKTGEYAEKPKKRPSLKKPSQLTRVTGASKPAPKPAPRTQKGAMAYDGPNKERSEAADRVKAKTKAKRAAKKTPITKATVTKPEPKKKTATKNTRLVLTLPPRHREHACTWFPAVRVGPRHVRITHVHGTRFDLVRPRMPRVRVQVRGVRRRDVQRRRREGGRHERSATNAIIRRVLAPYSGGEGRG